MHALAISLLLMSTPNAPDLEAQTRSWHEKRIKNLTADEGWLTLVALDWMDEGENTAGSAPDSKLLFPKSAPPRIGTFTRRGAEVSFAPAPGAQVQKGGQPFAGGALRTDTQGEPDVLSLGTFRFHVIQRGDRVGLRVKDVEAPARREFKGIDRFPVSARWRVEGRLEPSPTPSKIAVPNVLGAVEEQPSPGAVAFELQGKQYRLYPVQEGERLFFIFGDETNKKDSYGAGRFLYADPPQDGKVILDFNRAYNPPCAFSAYATCPLPPKENRLPVRVEAGERRYGHH